ncbi:MAG: rhodanese-like domain-containing protein [Deltaproteobacteria bacterium]|nr:rhodanese-like domain-containing protein [Deltaproteobacteria bacterium]
MIPFPAPATAQAPLPCPSEAPDRVLGPEILLAATIIFLLAGFSALADWGIFPDRHTASVVPTPGAAWKAFSDFGQLEAFISTPGAVILDARIPELYALGRIPGALSLPADSLERGDRDALSLMASIPADATVIAYCSEPLCPLAGRLADLLAQVGRLNVHVFTPGFDGWLDSGRAVEETHGDG